jgi:cytochrome oxidase assembly protein ShyY1
MRLLFSRRWLGYLGLAVLFAAICVALSMWQVARTNEAREGNRLIHENYTAEPRPLAEMLPELDSYDPEQEWSQVSMTGRYLSDQQLLVRNRPMEGNPGFDQLVPLLLDDGSVFVVDRGWLPTGNEQDAPDAVPQPTRGEVSVVVRIRAGQPTFDGRTAQPGQIATIHLPTVAELVDRPTYTGAYGLMVSESPAVAEVPKSYAEPSLNEGLHISYAIQWILFGIMAFFGLGYAIRQEYRLRNADDPEEAERAAERERRRASKPRTDSEVEDEIIDAGR